MHKLQRFLTGFFILFILTACGSDQDSQNNSEQSPLIGLWITNSCDQVENTDDDSTHLWAKGNYEFTSYGRIYSTPKLYQDSDCTLPHITAEDPTNVQPMVSYQDLGETMLQEGIAGRAFIFNMTFDGEIYPTDAFFTIDQDKLCFSEVLTFEALRFGFEIDGSMDIDFESCLIRS